jgi:hypothetical protein
MDGQEEFPTCVNFKWTMSKGARYSVPQGFTTGEKVDFKKVQANRSAFVQAMVATHHSPKHDLREVMNLVCRDGVKGAHLVEQCKARGLYHAYDAAVEAGLVSRKSLEPTSKVVVLERFTVPQHLGNESVVHSVFAESQVVQMSAPTRLQTLWDTRNSCLNAAGRRVVFCPTRQRRGAARLSYRIDNTVVVAVVNCVDFDYYRERWGSEVFIVGMPPWAEGVGSARFWCVALAQKWSLTRMWMIDDSVNHLHRKSPGVTKAQMQPSVAFLELERIMDQHNTNLAIIGPSTSQAAQNASHLFIQRTPTSAVLLNVPLITEKRLQYVQGLYHKEDGLFASDCVQAGCFAMVYNGVVIDDSRFESGGCMSPISPSSTMSPTSRVDENVTEEDDVTTPTKPGVGKG